MPSVKPLSVRRFHRPQRESDSYGCARPAGFRNADGPAMRPHNRSHDIQPQPSAFTCADILASHILEENALPVLGKDSNSRVIDRKFQPSVTYLGGYPDPSTIFAIFYRVLNEFDKYLFNLTMIKHYVWNVRNVLRQFYIRSVFKIGGDLCERVLKIAGLRVYFNRRMAIIRSFDSMLEKSQKLADELADPLGQFDRPLGRVSADIPGNPLGSPVDHSQRCAELVCRNVQHPALLMAHGALDLKGGFEIERSPVNVVDVLNDQKNNWRALGEDNPLAGECRRKSSPAFADQFDGHAERALASRSFPKYPKRFRMGEGQCGAPIDRVDRDQLAGKGICEAHLAFIRRENNRWCGAKRKKRNEAAFGNFGTVGEILPLLTRVIIAEGKKFHQHSFSVTVDSYAGAVGRHGATKQESVSSPCNTAALPAPQRRQTLVEQSRDRVVGIAPLCPIGLVLPTRARQSRRRCIGPDHAPGTKAVYGDGCLDQVQREQCGRREVLKSSLSHSPIVYWPQHICRRLKSEMSDDRYRPH